MRFKQIILLITIVAVICTLVRGTAWAQGGSTVWPTRFEMTILRGGECERLVTVANYGDRPIVISAYVMDFTIDPGGGVIFSEPGHKSYSASRWLSLNATEFEIAPGLSRQVEIAIAVPDGVEPGGHYAAVLFETETTNAGQGVSVSTRIPSLFYISIPGVTGADIATAAEIVSLLMPGIVDNKMAQIGVVVRNTGNVHVAIAARAYLTDFLGRRSEVDMGQVTLLPGGEGELSGAWQQAPVIGRVKANVVIGYVDDYGGLVNLSRKGAFWIVPWGELLVFGAAFGLLSALVVVFNKRYRLRLERRGWRRPRLDA